MKIERWKGGDKREGKIVYNDEKGKVKENRGHKIVEYEIRKKGRE